MRIQTARIYYRGQPCPRQIEITEGEGATSPRAVSSSIPKEVPSAMGQPQERGREAIPRETITSALNTHS